MIEYIKNNNQLVSIIIKANYSVEGINFFTPDSFELQLGYMNRDQNYTIKPHFHLSQERTINKTYEVLLIKSGEVQIDFFDKKNFHFDSKILYTGDVILIGNCGHGFKMLQKTEIIEIKQGPFDPKDDKIHF